MSFFRVEGFNRATGKTVNLDIQADDLESAKAKAVSLGVGVSEVYDLGGTWASPGEGPWALPGEPRYAVLGLFVVLLAVGGVLALAVGGTDENLLVLLAGLLMLFGAGILHALRVIAINTWRTQALLRERRRPRDEA